MALSTFQKAVYSVGHVLNDLCAAMWFSYILVFFTKVLEFSNAMAGSILLIGQIADGIATPFVGYESDKSPFICKYGRRKTWHLVGTVCVAITFPLLFMECLECNLGTPKYVELLYYAPLVVIFQFGWASNQINHLALIPDLTNDDGEKVTLNALRYAFTVISSITVYGIAWLVLQMPKSAPSISSCSSLFSGDASSFRILVLSVVGVGAFFSIVFHFGLNEKQSSRNALSHFESDLSDREEAVVNSDECTPLIRNVSSDFTRPAHWYQWFKKINFYQMAFLYMCTRLVVNLSQVYMPMFVTDTLKLEKTFIAIVPLVTYLSSFVSALLTRPISALIKQELLYAGGCVFVLAACIWAHFIVEESNQIFGIAVLLGFGNSIILIVALSLIARLIGTATHTAAFVYGSMSLTDKFSNGIAVEIVQLLNPCECSCPEYSLYFRKIMTYVVGGITIAALVGLITMHLTEKYRLHRLENPSTENTA